MSRAWRRKLLEACSTGFSRRGLLGQLQEVTIPAKARTTCLGTHLAQPQLQIDLVDPFGKIDERISISLNIKDRLVPVAFVE